MLQDRIDILDVQLLNTERTLVEQMRQVSEELSVGLGWHYLLDLAWAAKHLDPSRGMRIMDAGAGTGVMQWWLAAQGVNLLSVDRASRADLGFRFRAWCPVQGLRASDLQPLCQPALRAFLPPKRPSHWPYWPCKLRNAVSRAMMGEPSPPDGRGTVTVHNQDLADMPDITDASVDAVVSISALEHNEPDALRGVVKELMRALKPGGRLIATLGAARDRDWFHDPSKGWCYTEATLRDIFHLPTDCPSNYDRYDDLFEALRDCAELRDNLADFYFKSGNNGMPWGVWDPKYQPVGVVKMKRTEYSGDGCP